MKRLRYTDALTLVFLLILGVAACLSGCAGGTEIGNPEAVSFPSNQALAAYLEDQYARSALPTTLWALDNDAQPGWTDNKAFAGEKGYSETNIQEAGVDESDTVKTDGTFLYVAGEKEVRIISALPPQSMQTAGSIRVNGLVNSLYLYEKTLVILYTPSDGEGAQWIYNDNLKMIDVGMPYWNPIRVKSGIILADVSVPSAPSVIKDIQIDGSLFASRVTEGNLHVISQFIPDLPDLELWYDGTASGREATVESNRQALQSMTLDDYLPSYALYDGSGDMIKEGRLVTTENLVKPATPSGGTIVSLITVSLSDLAKDFSAIGFVADIHHVYASTRAVYMISTIYQGDTGEGTLKDPEIYQTRIYQFDILNGSVAYSAEGEVSGHILNRFSLGEYDNILRIATTTGYVWDGSASNHVFCLKKEDKNLAAIGRLENLAPGERLYSARFIGDRGFLVTFEEADPLFTLDLSDPYHPMAVGELKTPGYATYLHPLDNDHLLAIGKDTVSVDNQALEQGLRLSVYDVTDFAVPRLVASEKIGDRGTVSEALFNQKAITFLAEKNLLALPVNLNEIKDPENPEDGGANTFNGLYVYRLTDDYGFDFLGRIPLSDGGETNNATYYPDWYRGVFMDDYIYALTPYTVKAAPIDNIVEPFITLDLME